MPAPAKQDYTDIDAAIVRIINTRPGVAFGDIRDGVGDLVNNWRIIDRRLQNLKNKQLIQFSRKGGWIPAKSAE